MSGIWGYTCQDMTQNSIRAKRLAYWTEAYGREGSGQANAGSSGMGCHLEHLSERVPISAAVLDTKLGKAVVDAVLYNRDEIAEQLQLEHVEELSDEELLLQLVCEKGYSALATVNGDFAGAICENSQRSWVLFRDHMGIRPLFYYLDDKQFAFSTDMRGLTALPEADLMPAEVTLYQEIAGYNPLSLCGTEFEQIRCVHPGSVMTVSRTDDGFAVKTEKYWELGKRKDRLENDEAYQKELRRLITDSVHRRLEAVSGKVGAELSGGLDSCIIDILINREGRDACYYSWSYDPEKVDIKKRDERQVILDLCEQEKITCHFAEAPSIATMGKVETELEGTNPPYINTEQIGVGSKWVHSQGAKVMFTGHGGDEGVSHRCNLYEIWFHKEYFYFFRTIYRGTKGKTLRLGRTMSRAVKQFIKQNRRFRTPYYSEVNAGNLLSDAFKARMEQMAPHPLLEFAFDPVSYTLQGGPQVRLDNVALQGAQNGVRYMVPFMDYRVFDYAVSIPRHQFQNGYGTRWVYRKAFDDLMPQSLRDMNYKDIPSRVGYRVEGYDYNEAFHESVHKVIEHIDWSYWDRYIDRSKAEALAVREFETSEDGLRATFEMNALIMIARMQNMMRRTAAWCDAHDREESPEA